MSAIPIICHADGRRFTVATVTDDLRCACGSDDLDLDDRTASWETDQEMDLVDDTASVKQKVTCSTCFTDATITATDPAQPMPPCPNCGAETLSPAGSTLATKTARIQVRKDTHRGKDGFTVSGTDPDGRNIKVFTEDEAQARRIADGIRAGDREVVQREFSPTASLRVRNDVPARRISVKEHADREAREAKVAEIAEGIRATNPSIDPRQARRVAEETVRRFPKVAQKTAARFQPGDEVVYTNWNGATQEGKVVADPAPGMPGDSWVEFDWGGTFGDGQSAPVSRSQLKKTSAKTAMPNPVDLGVEVGDIFYSSWGYDQTNVNFYEVTGLTPASVRLREVSKRVEGNGVVPNFGSYIGQEFTSRIKPGYREDKATVSSPRNIAGHGGAWYWDGTPKYDTRALGYPGH